MLHIKVEYAPSCSNDSELCTGYVFSTEEIVLQFCDRNRLIFVLFLNFFSLHQMKMLGKCLLKAAYFYKELII